MLVTASIGLIECNGKYYMQVISAEQYQFYYVLISETAGNLIAEQESIQCEQWDSSREEEIVAHIINTNNMSTENKDLHDMQDERGPKDSLNEIVPDKKLRDKVIDIVEISIALSEPISDQEACDRMIKLGLTKEVVLEIFDYFGADSDELVFK